MLLSDKIAQPEKYLHEILNALDSVIWSMEPDTFKLLYLNKAAYEVSGRLAEDYFNDPDLWFNIR